MTYAKGLSSVPYPLGTPEWDSFLNYVRAYYNRIIPLSHQIAGRDQRIFRIILTSMSSPLVFLWEKWQLLGSEQRLPYATQAYREELEKRIEEVKKTTKKAEQRGFPT